MKKRNWICIVLILLSLAAFFSYRMMAAMGNDSRPPEIRMDGSVPEISVKDPKSALTEGITAIDREDGDVTDSLVVENITMVRNDGTVSVSYAAFDAAGNVTRAQREAKYTDYRSPRFSLRQPMIYMQGQNFDVLSNIRATDLLDGDIQHRVRATMLGEGDLSQAGTHVIRFQVTNSLGDTHTQHLPVDVITEDLYDADMELTDYLIYLPRGSAYDPEHYLQSFTRQGRLMDLTGGLPARYVLQTKGQVQTQNPGVYTIEYIVTYTEVNENNSSISGEYVARSKQIVIVEG
jgi:hypothetical protein